MAKLRKEIPDIALRTTLIAGFPGETQADHEEVMEFIDEVEFDRLGVFTYSREEDTPAATMPDQIDQDIMDTWRDELMALQQEISIDKSAQMVGKTIDVMVEGYIAEEILMSDVRTRMHLMLMEWCSLNVTGNLCQEISYL